MRIGHGFDVHKFGSKNPLIMGGVCIPFIKGGLLAYSDGDVVIHAIIDALFGAANLGSIGSFFPSNNLYFKNINSRILLKKSWKIIINKGLHLKNLDVTIMAQNPKLTPYILEMRNNIAKDINDNINNINIKATTTDYLGFIGRNEGIACEALVLLY